MNDIAEPNPVFRKPLSRAESKAETTDRAAREIMDAEASRREAKTEMLRRARLAREALIAAAPPKAAKPRKAAKIAKKK